jgi:glucokinase
MQALGLDISDRKLRAVVLDEHGAIARRIRADAADAPSVLDGLAGAGAFDAVGVSTDDGNHGIDHPLVRYSHGCRPGAAAIVAESWIGAARGAQHAVCLSIGERVLAGILLDGQPWAGAHGLAGSAAWLAMNPVERQDYRKFGSLAAEVSNKGIARRLAWRIQAGDHSAVLERAGDLEAITAQHVFDGARAGDGVSISVVRDTAKYIGMAISNLASAIDPERLVLGGAVAAAGDLLLEPVRQECARRLPPALIEQFRLEISPLGDDDVAIGAARLAVLARP